MTNENVKKVPGTAFRLASWIKGNIGNYAMYVALVVIFVLFQFTTDGKFLKADNLTNLINQTGYVAVLAIGMTLILIIKHIDLSVGFVAGFVGAVAAIMMRNGMPIYIVIPAVLLLGAAIGAYHGALVAIVGVPAFVTTLAGMFIFRGLLLLTTAGTGSIIVGDKTFKAMSQGTIPDLPVGGSFHVLTMIIAVIGIVLVVATQFNSRKKSQKYNFKVKSMTGFVCTQIFIAIVILAVAYMLAGFKGIPWTAVIVGVVLFLYNFLLNRTRFGRYVYGIGGNAEATELSGVNVKKITFIVFISCSVMAALGGMLYTARIGSASPQAGVGFELDAIASSYIGGVSVGGGVGKVTNTIIGALVIQSLTNGMNMMGVDISLQYVVKGLVFIAAVAFDVINRRLK